VGKRKRVDVYLEERKRRRAYIFRMKQVPVFIIPPIMGGQDSNLNFKLLSSRALIIPNIEAEPSFL
jgi:hypothetical protein